MDDYYVLRLMNLSILSIIICPFGNIIFPGLIFWRFQENPAIKSIGKKIFVFQLVMTAILFFVSGVICHFVGRGNGVVPIPVYINYTLIVLLSVGVVMSNSLQLDRKFQAPYYFSIMP